MNPIQQDFSKTYRSFSDDQIASVHAEIDSLTDEARLALAAEIQRRGLDDAQVAKLYKMELRHEAKFDRRQKEHQKKVLFGSMLDDLKQISNLFSFLLRGDPSRILAVIAILLAVGLIAALMFRYL